MTDLFKKMPLRRKRFIFRGAYKYPFKACFFSLSIITTIGYGNVATKTIGGRVFCLLFGIVGIPFMLSVLADVGGLLAGVMQVGKLHSSFEFLKSFYCIILTVAPSSKVTWGSNKEHALEWAERMGILRTRKVESFSFRSTFSLPVVKLSLV